MNDEDDQDDYFLNSKLSSMKSLKMCRSLFLILLRKRIDEAKMLWENSIGSLKQVLGATKSMFSFQGHCYSSLHEVPPAILYGLYISSIN